MLASAGSCCLLSCCSHCARHLKHDGVSQPCHLVAYVGQWYKSYLSAKKVGVGAPAPAPAEPLRSALPLQDAYGISIPKPVPLIPGDERWPVLPEHLSLVRSTFEDRARWIETAILKATAQHYEFAQLSLTKLAQRSTSTRLSHYKRGWSWRRKLLARCVFQHGMSWRLNLLGQEACVGRASCSTMAHASMTTKMRCRMWLAFLNVCALSLLVWEDGPTRRYWFSQPRPCPGCRSCGPLSCRSGPMAARSHGNDILLGSCMAKIRRTPRTHSCTSRRMRTCL